jgi:hypothetical protein
VSSALYKSCPAANALPLVGALAFGLSNWTCNCCSAAAAPADEGAAIGAEDCSAAMLSWLGRCVAAKGVGVAAPESVPRGRVEAWERGVGSMTFVRFGRGDEGRDGGSWTGTGVSDIFFLDVNLRLFGGAVKVVKDAFGGANDGKVFDIVEVDLRRLGL